MFERWMQEAIRYISDPNNLWQQFKKSSFTTDLEVLRQFSLDDAGAVKVQSNSYQGEAQSYQGFGSVNMARTAVIQASTGWNIYHLDQFKVYPMPIDRIEAEESLNLFVTRVNGLLKYKVTPDVDKYRFSKLLYEAGFVINGGTDANGVVPSVPVAVTVSNIFQTIQVAVEKMAQEEVSPEGYILYTTPTYMRLLENSDRITRFINVREEVRYGINVEVRTINTANGRIEIIVVPDKYFCTFTFGANSTTPSVKNLNIVGAPLTNFVFLLVARNAVNAVVKVNEARVIPSGIIPGFLGDLFELYIYHDIFAIKRNNATGTPDATTRLTPAAFNGIVKCTFSP